MTAWRLYQDAHALCQQRANLRQGTGEGFFIFHSLSVNCFSFDSLASATTYFNLNQRNEMRVNRTYVGGIYHLSDLCAFVFLLSFCSAQLL